MFRFVKSAGLGVAAAGLLTACAPDYKEMGPMTAEPRISDESFVARDGVRLPYSVWGPRENPSTIVIAAHSFGEFRDAFALIGKHLAEQNVAVWAYDQRGFGNGPHPGVWAGTDTMVQDFKDFTSAVQGETGGDIPLIMMGESMGGAIVLSALTDTSTPRPRAIVLSGPGVREDRPRRYWFNAGLWLVTRIVPGYEVQVERPYDSRLDEYHAKRWASDSKIINQVRLDTYYGLIRLSDYASNNTKDFGIPTLVLYGTEDDQIHPNSVCALMNRLGRSGSLQVFQDKPHLMFQDKDQDDVLQLIDQWITDPTTAPGSHTAQFCED